MADVTIHAQINLPAFGLAAILGQEYAFVLPDDAPEASSARRSRQSATTEDIPTEL
jgi:hypothetical protein